MFLEGQGLIGYNMFAYCKNNPVNRVDPEGEFWIAAIAIVTSALVLFNHAVNKIRDEVLDQRSISEATQEINNILEKYNSEFESESNKAIVSEKDFTESSIKIQNSYKVTSKYDRQYICEIIAHTESVNADSSTIATEWYLHNLAYNLNILPSSSKDADLDFYGDKRKLVEYSGLILRIFGVR